MSTSLPPTDLVLAALHAIKNAVEQTNVRLDGLTAEVAKTNDRLDQTNARLDGTNERIDSLRIFTVQKLTDLNTKMDEGFERLTVATNKNTAEIHELRDRFDHFLTGQGAKLVQRMDRMESELARIAAKVDH